MSVYFFSWAAIHFAYRRVRKSFAMYWAPLIFACHLSGLALTRHISKSICMQQFLLETDTDAFPTAARIRERAFASLLYQQLNNPNSSQNAHLNASGGKDKLSVGAAVRRLISATNNNHPNSTARGPNSAAAIDPSREHGSARRRSGYPLTRRPRHAHLTAMTTSSDFNIGTIIVIIIDLITSSILVIFIALRVGVSFFAS
jgi:hypothetical protein